MIQNDLSDLVAIWSFPLNHTVLRVVRTVRTVCLLLFCLERIEIEDKKREVYKSLDVYRPDMPVFLSTMRVTARSLSGRLDRVY
jgi:hypothetical protein